MLTSSVWNCSLLFHYLKFRPRNPPMGRMCCCTAPPLSVPDHVTSGSPHTSWKKRGGWGALFLACKQSHHALRLWREAVPVWLAGALARWALLAEIPGVLRVVTRAPPTRAAATAATKQAVGWLAGCRGDGTTAALTCPAIRAHALARHACTSTCEEKQTNKETT